MVFDDLARTTIERSLAVLLLLIALPLIGLTALASLACYRAWPFFVQDRVGRHGTTFHFVKVRSLPPETDRYADKYSIGESHIPSLMRTVRRLHLDELPQLVHVVRGQMAFVGPRPEMPNLHASLPEAFAAERVSVLPGLTGLWQIGPHCRQLIGERTEYDRLYIGHRTVALDAWILRRTVLKMTLGHTTHLHAVPPKLVRRVPLAAPQLVLVDQPPVRSVAPVGRVAVEVPSPMPATPWASSG